MRRQAVGFAAKFDSSFLSKYLDGELLVVVLFFGYCLGSPEPIFPKTTPCVTNFLGGGTSTFDPMWKIPLQNWPWTLSRIVRASNTPTSPPLSLFGPNYPAPTDDFQLGLAQRTMVRPAPPPSRSRPPSPASAPPAPRSPPRSTPPPLVSKYIKATPPLVNFPHCCQ